MGRRRSRTRGDTRFLEERKSSRSREVTYYYTNRRKAVEVISEEQCNAFDFNDSESTSYRSLKVITMGTHKPRNSSLPYPFPIPLSKPAIQSNFGFFCYSADDRFCFHNFHSAYAAKHFALALIDGADYKWVNPNEILTEKGLRIRGEQGNDLRKALDHQFTKEEAAWDIPEPYLTYYRQFIGRRRLTIDDIPASEPQVTRTPDDETTRGAVITRQPRKPRTERAKITAAKAKVKTGDHITIGTICTELGYPPRVCRAILRDLKEPKPAHGWAWSKSDADRIRSKLRARLK